jgi:hypothetical protein
MEPPGPQVRKRGRDNATAAGEHIATAPDLDLGPSGGEPLDVGGQADGISPLVASENTAGPIGGYLVRVLSPRLGGGEPVRSNFLTAVCEPQEAKRLIEMRLNPEETVEGVFPVEKSRMPPDLPSGEWRIWP